MHHSEINQDEKIGHVDADLSNSTYGDRPILLGHLVEVDGTDILVPASARHQESVIVALTHEQAAQALIVLATQIGKDEALLLIEGHL